MLRRTGRVAGLVLTLGLLAVAARAAEDAPDPVLAAVGSELFQQYCAACHGVSGRGDGPAAGSLRTRPADLTRIAARRGGRFPDAEIARKIDGRFELPAHGSREMPIWGRRFGEQVTENTTQEEVVRGRLLILVEYLKSIQRGE